MTSDMSPPRTRRDWSVGVPYELTLAFGDLPIGTIIIPTGNMEIDFLAGTGTSAIEVDIPGQERRFLRCRKDVPLRGREVAQCP